MSTENTSHKTARLETRVSPEVKQLIERAAAHSGRTISDFVVTHIEAAAKRVVEQYERLKLDQNQSRVLVDALLSPKKPNKKFKQAVEDYRKRVKSR